jgi:DNA-binding transcriptional LysR family regulator
MDLNLIALFVTVAKASSFSKAATQLEVPRSTVSRGIAQLERELGVQLLSRTTRHVALTTAGTALYSRVAPQIASLAAAIGELPEQEEQPSGTLRLTAPNDLGAIVMPSIFAGFALRHPTVTLDVRLTNRVVDLVAEGFDAAIRVTTGRLSDSSLVAKKLATSQMQVFASPEYLARAGSPKTCEDAAEHAWVVVPAVRMPAPLSKPKQVPRLAADDVRFVHEMVRAGVGLGLLPPALAHPDVVDGRLVRVLPKVATPSGAIYLVHPPSKHVPRKVIALREYLLEQLAKHPLLG